MNEPTTSHLTIHEGGKVSGETPVLANAALPEWIELLPAGEFNGRDGRGPFRLNNPQRVVSATLALGMKAGIPIDYDHATDLAAPQGRPAPAAGWIRQLAVRDGAIWGQVEWTRHGAAAIATREYRYVSPVFEYTSNGEVMRLLRAALTNNPNLYMTAISARAARPVRIGSGDAKPSEEENEMETLLAQLREILGLDETSGADEAIEVIRSLRAAAGHNDDADDDDGNDGGAATTGDDQRGAPYDAGEAGAHAGAADPARYVSMSQFQSTLTELNSLRAARARERAEHAVNEAMRAGKLIPAQREWAIAYCQADHRGFARFVARQPALFAANSGFDGEPPAAIRAGHFDDDGMRGSGAGGSLSQTERAICGNLNLKAGDFIRHKTQPGYFLSH